MILTFIDDIALTTQAVANANEMIALRTIGLTAEQELVKIATAVHKAAVQGIGYVAYKFTSTILRHENWDDIKELIDADIAEAGYTKSDIVSAGKLVGYVLTWLEEDEDEEQGGNEEEPQNPEDVNPEVPGPEDDEDDEPSEDNPEEENNPVVE